jgi:hypothetical protein
MPQRNRNQRINHTEDEDQRLQQFIETIGPPREPTVRIYRIEPDGKQTRLGSMALDGCDEEAVRAQFGAGAFLLRTVRSNGTYGPSTVLRIAEMLRR